MPNVFFDFFSNFFGAEGVAPLPEFDDSDVSAIRTTNHLRDPEGNTLYYFVPEPGTGLLLMTGLVGLVAQHRRRA